VFDLYSDISYPETLETTFPDKSQKCGDSFDAVTASKEAFGLFLSSTTPIFLPMSRNSRLGHVGMLLTSGNLTL